MILKNKFAIGCLVQWYEIDLIGEYIESLKQSLNEIENKDNPDLTETNFKHRLFLLFAEFFSPSFWGRPINFFRFLKANIKYVLQNRMQKYTT